MMICGAIPSFLRFCGVSSMYSAREVTGYLEEELEVEHYNEAGDKFNGVLVDAADSIGKVGLCTNCTFETIENAVEAGCDLVISHHGGWEEFDGDVLEEKKRRIRENGLTWFIAHHCLDCADERYGVAVALAEKLGISVEGAYADVEGGEAGRYGKLSVRTEEFLDRLEQIEPGFQVVGSLDGVEQQRIGVIGGGGGVFRELVDETKDVGCDVLVTGNSAFFTEIHAHEIGLTLVTLEETSSEKWGVYRLGEHLKERFDELATVRLDERNW